MYTCVFGHVERDTHKPSSTPFMGNSLYIPPPPKTDMAIENPPFEDVFPVENGDFPMSC